MSHLPRIRSRPESRSIRSSSQFEQHATVRSEPTLLERIRLIETRMAELERKHHLSDLPDDSKVIYSLTGRFEDQMSHIEFRLARLEGEFAALNSIDGGDSRKSRKSNAEISELTNKISEVAADLSDLKLSIDERFEHMADEFDHSTGRLQKEIHSRTTCGPTFTSPSPRNYANIRDNDLREIIKSFDQSIQNLQTETNNRIMALSLSVDRLNMTNQQQRRGMDGGRADRRNGAQSESQFMLNSDTEYDKTDSNPRISQKLDSVRHKVEAELSAMKRKQQETSQRFSQAINEVEETMETLRKRVSTEKMEMDHILSAEIRTRKSKDDAVQKFVKKLDEKINTLADMLQVPQRLAPVPPLMDDRLAQTLFRNPEESTSAIKDLYQRFQVLADQSKTQSEALNRQLQERWEKLQRCNEDIRKAVDYKASDMDEHMSMLHNEVIDLEVRISSLQEEKSANEKDASSDVCNLAKALFATKLVLQMRIERLEEQVANK